MPDFPIIDSHLHLWDPQRIQYPWLEQVPLLNRPFLLEDYRAACDGIAVEAMVFVQCEADFSQCLDELDWVTQQARKDSRIRAIVPWAPLELGEAARPLLERMQANPLVRGIRRIIQFESDPDFCLRPGFIRGVQSLRDFDFSFDICINHSQMVNTIELVRRCPGVRFILDHIGKPDIRNRVLDPWRGQMRELAGFHNVWVKLSGLVTEADHSSWKPEDLRPYIEHVLECFGSGRIIFGGDWPVALQATIYPRWIDAIDALLAGSHAGELQKIYRENSINFYRLDSRR